MLIVQFNFFFFCFFLRICVNCVVVYLRLFFFSMNFKKQSKTKNKICQCILSIINTMDICCIFVFSVFCCVISLESVKCVANNDMSGISLQLGAALDFTIFSIYKHHHKTTKKQKYGCFVQNQIQKEPNNNPKTKMWLFCQHFTHKSAKKQPQKVDISKGHPSFHKC